MDRRKFIGGAAALAVSPSEAWAKKKIIILKRRWNPTQLGSALVTWWNADDVATGAVTTWADRIGGLAPTQATGSLQPIKAPTSFNSAYGGVTFDGVDDFMLVASTGAMPTGTASGEIYGLISNTALAADTTIKIAFSYGAVTANNNRNIGRTGTGGLINKARIADHTTVVLVDDGVINPFNSSAIVSAKFDAVVQYGFMQGAAFSPTALQADAFNTTTNRTVFGGSASTTPGNFWQGPIRHIMVTNGVLSTADRQRLEGWLAWDGGIQGQLPATHPYKNARP